MRIALIGMSLEELQQHRRRMETYYSRMGEPVEIQCYEDAGKLQETMFQFHIILLRETGISEFEQWLEREQRKRICLVTRKEIVTCPVEDVCYIRAELSTIHLHRRNGTVTLPLSISEAEQQLEAYGFIRIHKSYLVNSMHIFSLTRSAVTLEDGTELPVSKYRIQEVREQYRVNGNGSGL
ncbi:MAG: LytTR family transcriptional regulator [Lachnospiraceae bacterium]|nr:LytTR family transcriptional regulator [Lachnospiraceae bacterium]